MTSSKATVFVVDDEPSVLRSLGRLLRANGYDVETFASAREFLQAGREDTIGCLVLDVQMPDLNGLELQQTLAEIDLPLPIVFITGHGDIPTSVRAMKAGAVDFLSKPFDAEDLLQAIDRALDRIRRESGEREVTREAKLLVSTLTPREHEVMLHVLAGEMNKEIAAKLGTSEKTVKVHRGRVMRKMKVQSVADLVRLCEKAGIRLP